MVQTVFILNNRATFICPKCRAVKTIDAGAFVKTGTRVNVRCKCPCGHAFQAVMERRSYLRREITLPGVYSRYLNDEPVETGQMVVMDLSRAGLRFKPHVLPAFQIGDQLQIVFHLNDLQHTMVEKTATIRSIDPDMQVGTEFSRKEPYGKIGMFLFG